MIPTHLLLIANHLWQSTFFATAAGLLTLVLRKNRAAVRYWIWLAASVKFLIPFSLLVGIGSRLLWRPTPVALHPQLANAVHEFSQPFVLSANALPSETSKSVAFPEILLAVWLCGVLLGLIFWTRLLLQIRAIKRDATPLHLDLPIRAMQAPEGIRIEPGVFGILKPILVLPAGITYQLTPAQLDTVLAHELCHVRRKDNLTAAIHMVVEIIFWFHPLVWWIRTRLVAEREQACDEAVAGDPHVYAEAILNVCKLYAGSPLMCVSGVTGADLKRRIANIVNRKFGCDLSLTGKLSLALTALAVVLCPIVAGLLWGQSDAPASAQPAFEVTSVKPYDPKGPPYYRCSSFGDRTTLRLVGCTLRQLVKNAYSLKDYQMDAGGPGWIATDEYVFEARPAAPATRSEMMQMLQLALAGRFQLRIHWMETESPIYVMQTASRGLKLQPASKTDPCGEYHYPGPGTLWSDCGTLDDLADTIEQTVIGDRPVLNRTDVTRTNQYQFRLNYAPGDDTSAAPSIFDAMQDQLGLTLKAGKGTVKTLFIDQARRPEPN